MKKILTLIFCFAVITAFAKKITEQFTVQGTCVACETKIEAALDVKGVSFADWDLTNKMLTVRYNDKKISIDEIHTIVANAGFATSKMAAAKKGCCTSKAACSKSAANKKTGCCSGKSSCSKAKAKAKIQ